MQEDKQKPSTSHSTSHLVIPKPEQTDAEQPESAKPASSEQPELGNWKWSESTPTKKEKRPDPLSSDLVESGAEATGETEAVSPVVSQDEQSEGQEKEVSTVEGNAAASSEVEKTGKGEATPDSPEQRQVDPDVIQEASHDDEWEEDDDEPVRRPIGKLKWQQDDEKGSSVDVTAPIPVAATTEAAPEAPSPTTEPSQAKVEEKRNESKVASTEPRRWSGAKWVKRTLLFLPLVWIIVLAVGLVIGYSVMGNQPPGEVFNPDLWKHLYDLIYG